MYESLERTSSDLRLVKVVRSILFTLIVLSLTFPPNPISIVKALSPSLTNIQHAEPPQHVRNDSSIMLAQTSTITSTVYLPIIARSGSGTDTGLPYIQLLPGTVEQGEDTTAYGRHFCGGPQCSTVTISIGSRQIPSSTRPNRDGTFQISFEVTELPAQYVVTATQTTTDSAHLQASAPLLVIKREDLTKHKGAVARSPEPPAQGKSLQPSAVGVVTAFQPNIANGGRTVGISIHPTNSSIAVAATESGGVFRTGDKGATWTHADSLPPFRMKDVEIAPDNGQIVIATASADSRVQNGGGIWRSVDGGATWQKPATADPPAFPCGSRVSAYGIAFLPGTTDVYIGTDCGLAVSHNQGATWSHTVPAPSRSRLGVFDVTARSSTNGVIIDVCAADGHHRSTNGGANWSAAGTGLPGCFSNGVGSAVNAISTSPLEQDVVFAATYGPFLSASKCTSVQAYESDDGGANWAALSTPVCFNRPPLIVARRSRDGNAQHIDVYYGDGVNVFRQTCTNTGEPGPRCSATAWTALTIDHADQMEVAFATNDNCPQFVISDGGVHRTSDCGATWSLTGGGNSGFNALQLYEMAGQVHPDHTDLYFGTQDNSIWASGDNGTTWPTNVCCEGFFLQIPHNSPNDAGQTFTGVACGPCGNFRTDAHLANYQNWNNPPGGGGNAFLIEPGVYIQFSASSPPAASLYLSTDTGATWNVVSGADVSQQIVSRPYVSGPASSPTVYIAASKPTSGGGFVNSILKLTGIRTTSASVNWADAGLISLDGYCNGDGTFVCPIVFGVDPNNPLHLIAVDGGSNEMKVSTNGGASWTVDQQLTALVTDNGRFLFDGQVHVVAFDPTNGNRILVGTEAAGVLVSNDGGQTWGRIAGSEQVSAATSFFVDEVRDSVFASSYGRGMWKIPTQLPIANAGGPYTTQEGTNITLDASGSSDPTGGTLTFAWDFDNNGTFNDATGSAPIFDRVGQAGVYIIRVKVTSSVGFSIATAMVTVNNVAPSVAFTTDSPRDEGSPLTVEGRVSDPGWLNSLTATVDWGDGVPPEPIIGTLENMRPDATLTFHITHVYADNGAYTIEVCGTDNHGATTCNTSSVGVNNVPPTVDAGQDQIIYEGDTVVLDPATFNDKGTLDTHTASINWGDGSPATAGIVSEAPFGPPGSTSGANGTVTGEHHYVTAVGVYTVTVTLTDDDGGVGSDTFRVTIVPGFLRFCAFADRTQSEGAMSLTLIVKYAQLDCATVPGGAPGRTRTGGIGSRGNMEAEDYAAIAGDMVSLQKDVLLKGDSSLAGNILAKGLVELDDKAQVSGSITTTKDIILKDRSIVAKNATAGGTVQLSGASVVSGTIQESATIPALPTITSVQFALHAGTQNVVATHNQVLEPGIYRNVDVSPGVTLTLRSGRYTFKRLRVDREAAIAFDLSAGFVLIDVAGDVEFKERTQMIISSPTGDATDILFRIAGARVQLGEKGVYLGTFLGLKASATLGQEGTLTGALYGNQVEVRERTYILGKPAAKVFAALLAESGH